MRDTLLSRTPGLSWFLFGFEVLLPAESEPPVSVSVLVGATGVVPLWVTVPVPPNWCDFPRDLACWALSVAETPVSRYCRVVSSSRGRWATASISSEY